jgi:competence protein ComEA
MIGIIGIVLLITGICYSCAFKKEKPSSELITSLTGSDNQSADDNQAFEDGQTSKEGLSSNASDDRRKSDKNQSFEMEETSDNHSKEDLEMSSDIYVHLCGAVKQPGVYQVSVNSRVIDLIEQAGGLTKEAAGDYINQAQQVTDGQRIYIPTKDEVKEIPAVTDLLIDEGNKENSSSSKMMININLADAAKLMELPGVGEAKAASIIEYRTTNGSFQTIEELMKIPGIKEGLFNKVSPFISVK